MQCPAGTSKERHVAACEPVTLDPDRAPTKWDPPRQHMPTEREKERARVLQQDRCLQHRIMACGVLMVGPAGSEAVICRDPQQKFTGPVQLVAPDRTVVTEGACIRSVPTGAWVAWRAGSIETVTGYDGGRDRGVVIERNNGKYQSIVLWVDLDSP